MMVLFRAKQDTKRSFVLDLVGGPLRQALSAALDGRKNRGGRRSSDTCHRFPCAIRTIQFHSQSIACWPFLNRNSRPHLPRSSLLRLRSVLAWRLVYDFETCAG